MIAINLITDLITPLKTSDKGIDALGMMEEYKVSHLPIVNNVDFLGLISESDIYSINNPEEPIGNYKLSHSMIFVKKYQHIFDVFKVLGMYELSLVPVLDDKNKYLGSITIDTISRRISNASFISSPGGIIVLEININNYSLSEISQIIESNNAKIMGMFINNIPDSTKLEVSLKVNKMDIESILQTFNRYDYFIKASYSEQESVFEDLNERYSSFMNYLDMGDN